MSRNRSSDFLSPLVGALLVLVSLLARAAETPRLNFIAIVTDDQAQWSLGAYGNREARTPHLDRLAREGARFLNAFVCTPVCSPSRAAFLTGRLGTQLGITDWIAPKEAKAGLGLPPESVTWAEVLQQHGYTTALIGKWHLGERPQFHPTQHGFGAFYGFLAGGTTPMNPKFDIEGENRAVNGSEPDLLTDAALRFVDTNRTRPFALQLNFRAPHMPYGPVPEEDSAPFKNLDPTVPMSDGADLDQVKQWTRAYYASIHSVDRNLGRLLRQLDASGLATNTILLFTSDHGYMIGQHGLHAKGNAHQIIGRKHGPKRPNMFEESIRVPLIIRWPGVVKPGTEIADSVSNLDTFATVLGLLGLPPPRDWRHEGIDFSPLLRGRKLPPRDAIFGQYDLHNGGLAYLRMIRTDEWKLVRHFLTNGLDELYDLKADPGETRNLFDAPHARKVRDQLQGRLTAWQRSIHDPLLERK